MKPFTNATQVTASCSQFDVDVATPPAAPDRVPSVAVAVMERDRRSTARAAEDARLSEQARRPAVSGERNRPARERHDAVAQSLFGMTLITQALPRLLERDPERAMERLGRLHELGRGALAELQALIAHPPPAALTEPLAGS